MKNEVTRRGFLGAASAATGLAFAAERPASAPKAATTATVKTGGRAALLGGEPVRTAKFPSWPVIKENDERTWMEVLRSGHWNRYGHGHYVKQFEQTWAQHLGAKHCLATANGTSALFTSLGALGVGPGDEVIVPPYTFVATINVVLLHHALPVFVDSDRETFQIDARKIEAAITPRTRVILPVHLGGSAADMDTILAVAKKRNLPVVEDACQAHLGEWRHRKLSTVGTLGCFSFQASKNINSGEGGAVMTNNPELMEVCESFHNNGRGRSGASFSYVRNGANLRMTEFQGALLLEQFTRLEEQSRLRTENAEYLTRLLSDIPGIAPARMYDGCTRNAYHLYMFRYDKAQFANLPRATFLKAMKAEGIPCSGGYTPLNKELIIKNTLETRAYRSIYSAKTLAEYEERNHCPANDQLCEEGVWFTQTMMLAGKSDMDDIAEAVRKIRAQAADLASA